MVFGAVYIQRRLGITDRETMELITESPYFLFFIGLSAYQALPPFDPSMMVHFRKRIGPDLIKVCNDITKANGITMIQELLATSQQEDGTIPEEQKQLAAIEEALGVKPASLEFGSNWGTLILDATCVPEDIPSPVDLRLLNAREVTEKIIDEFFKQLQGKINRKPRCNRDKTRNLFLSIIKKNRPRREEIRDAKRFQPNEISRNLRAIDAMIYSGTALLQLGAQLYRKLLVSSEIHRQQQEMYYEDSRRVNDRIVNLSKPHAWPIVRGKAGKKTEFGARVSISGINSFMDVDRISWDNSNEANDLIARATRCKEESGCYPATIFADAIYITVENKKFYSANGIRLGGRPRKKQTESELQTEEQQELFKSDMKINLSSRANRNG